MWFDLNLYQEFIDYCMDLHESNPKYVTYTEILHYCGYTSAKFDKFDGLMYLDSHEYTHFVLRWS